MVEEFKSGKDPFNKTSVEHAYFGPWVPVSSLVRDARSLHDALKPHIHDVPGQGDSVPQRLVNLVTPPTPNKGRSKLK